MATLTESQLLLLNNFIYLNQVATRIDPPQTVKHWIDIYYQNGELTPEFKRSQGITESKLVGRGLGS